MIPNVPIEPDSRVTLRVYDPDRRVNPQATIRYLDGDANVLAVFQRRFDWPAQFQVTPALLPLYPAFMQIDVTSDVQQLLRQGDRITIQIEPVDTGQRLWAFVSVTSNMTQQVTVLVPN